MNQLMNRLPLLLATLLALPMGARACITVEYAHALGEPIRTTDESALILWNSKTRVEQFVRRADFQTKTRDFGFLVPTPTQPQLNAADDALFNDLEFELLPKRKVVVRRDVDWKPLLSSLFESHPEKLGLEETYAAASNTASFNDAKSVEVVERKRVGNYNASVVRASDARSLTSWLRAHHYAVSSDTRNWLAPYVRRGFFITAFQIVADANTGSAQADAVRLSFKSDAPFFPYRESKSAQKMSGGRSLRLFFVGQNRVKGTISNNGKEQEAWNAATSYSAPLDAAKLRAHGLNIPSGALRLTAFQDLSSPRHGWGDLKFASSDDQSEKTPPPHIIHKDARVRIPLDVLALAALGCAWCGARFRGRNST